MEKLKVKHDHKLTDIIKVCIFALFLILPILCFLPTGLYYGFNEHATNSETTTINYKYQSNEVNSLDDLVEGNIYYYPGAFDDIVGFYEQPQYLELTFYNGYVEFDIDNGISYANDITSNPLIFKYGSNDSYITFAETSLANTCSYFSSDEFIFSFNDLVLFKQWFNGNSLVTLPQYTDYNVIESVEINTNDTISNKMYQAWQGLWESPLYNWTNNNNFQFTINAFTNVFGITQQSYITNYLNYLLSLTAVYVVFDIVLAMFKWLTHLIGEK